ncbi:hypothetical protein BG000_010100 [Podila horticola]|nr:hypothetical protein BG000_010100 [Podila horticola]
MLRSSSLLVLSLLCLQAVTQAIETGRYLIQDNRGNYLGIGPVPPVFPPRDVPVRLLSSSLAEQWLVKQDTDGTVTISAGLGRPFDYKIVQRNDEIWLSAEKAPEPWSVTSVGDGKQEIKIPYGDLVFTADSDEFPQVHLRPAEGGANQKWTFLPINRDMNYHRGSSNRFCVQEQW